MLSLNQLDVLVSVVVIVDGDSPELGVFTEQTVSLLNHHFAYHEMILIDNGTSDGASAHLGEIRDQLSNVRLLRLARRHDWSMAVRAALESAVGDYVVILDSHLDPPELIPDAVARAAAGMDVVKVDLDRPRQPSLVDRFLGWLLAKQARSLLKSPVQLERATFMVFSRRAVNAFTRIRDRRTDPRYLNVLVGLPEARMTYEAWEGRPRREPWQRRFWATRLMANLIVANSATPLRFVSLLGLAASLGIVVFLGYVLAVSLIKERVAEGWITTSVMISGLFLVLFVMMTILSEYISRILAETQERPLYFIEDESHSRQTVGDADRALNVVYQDDRPERT